jgi:predicted thioesterase
VVITERTFGYTVTGGDSVRAIARGPEFTMYKPPVMASAKLLEVCELHPMEILRPHILPHQCTLGVWQRIDHSGPISLGTRLTIDVECRELRGSYSEWHVTVADDREVVGRIGLGFVTVDQEEFTRRLVHGKRGGAMRTEVGRQRRQEVS